MPEEDKTMPSSVPPVRDEVLEAKAKEVSQVLSNLIQPLQASIDIAIKQGKLIMERLSLVERRLSVIERQVGLNGHVENDEAPSTQRGVVREEEP